MPIPPTDSNGLLPAGIHDCTIEEIAAVFGRFRSSDRRVKLLRGLQEYLSRLLAVGIGRFLYVDGSFVTSEDAPHDIDVLLVLRNDADLAQQVPPFEYNLRSGRYLRRYFDIDFFFGYENDQSSQSILSLFQRVKGKPQIKKGILRLAL